MSEKVLGFKEKNSCYNKDAWLCGNCGLLHTDTVGECCEGIRKKHLVSVRLASESVDLKWLEKYVTHIRGCFEKNQPSDFEAGEETGRIEVLEVLLAEAKKEAKKK